MKKRHQCFYGLHSDFHAVPEESCTIGATLREEDVLELCDYTADIGRLLPIVNNTATLFSEAGFPFACGIMLTRLFSPTSAPSTTVT